LRGRVGNGAGREIDDGVTETEPGTVLDYFLLRGRVRNGAVVDYPDHNLSGGGRVRTYDEGERRVRSSSLENQ